MLGLIIFQIAPFVLKLDPFSSKPFFMSPTNFFDFRQRQKIIFPCPTVSCHLSITRTNSFNKARTHTQNHTHVNAWFLFYTRMHSLHLLHWISLTSPQAPPPSHLVTASPCLSRAPTHTHTHTHTHTCT